MGLAETASLLASLDLHDGLSPVVKTMSGSLDKLDTRLGKSSTRAYKAGEQIGTGIKSGVVIAGAALTSLAGLLLVSAHEGQEAQNVQIKYANAIKNSGKVSAAYVGILNAQQDALLNLSGADDEAIKAAQTQLIQMGLTGAQVEKLTALSLNLSEATGKDLTASTLAVGKAAQGSNKALNQLGIIVPKGADAIAILNQRFGGTTQALSGQLDTRLEVFNQRLANIREAAGQKLLPSLTKLVDVVSGKLVPAFGQFIDAILPTVISGLDQLSSFLSGGGATSALTNFLTIAKSAAPVIKGAAEATFTLIKGAVGLFTSLPPVLQSLAIAGLTVNKLTGGLVTNLAGGLIDAVIRSFRGLMNVNAGVVNVNGAVGGVPGGPVATAAGGLAGVLGAVAAPVISVAAVAAAGQIIGDQVHQQGQGLLSQTQAFAAKATDADLARAIDGVQQQLDGMQFNTFDSKNQVVAVINALREEQNRRAEMPTDLSAATMEAFRGKMADALKTTRVQDRKPDVLADRLARGVKNTGPSKTIDPRLKFLAGHHSGADDVKVVNALASGFESSKSPAFQNTDALKRAIAAVSTTIKTLPPKFTAPLRTDLTRLKTELSRREAAVKQAIQDKNLSVHVNVPVTNRVVINGREFEANLVRYRTTANGNIVVSTGGGGA